MGFANLPQHDGKINPEQPLNIAHFSTEEVDYFVHKLQARQLKLEQQNQALRLWAETLNNAFLALTTHTGHKAILNEILNQVRRLVPYCAANIMLLQHDALHLVCWQGYESYGSEALTATLERSLVQCPLEARVIQSQQNLIVPDTRYEPDWVELKGLSWIRSSVMIPICLHKKVLGLLKLDSDIPNKFLLKDVERLTPLANAAALALKKTLLNDQTQHELARRVVQAETEIIQLNQKLLTLQYAGTTITSGSNLQYVLNTVTREMAKLLKVEGCAIFKWDEVSNTILLISRYGLEGCWEEGLLVEAYLVTEFPLIQHVLVECRPQQISGSHPDVYPAESAYMQKANLKTLLAVPMEFRARTVGLIKIMDAQEERTFTNREIGLIQLLGNQVASAIENTRLYEQVQQQLVEMMEIEKDLRRIATKQHAILNAIPDSIFYLDRNGKLLNYKIVDNHIPLGILEAQIAGEGFDNTSPTNLIDLIRHYLDQKPLSNTTQSFEFQLLLPEEVQNFEIRLVPSGHNEVLAMVRNIT